jgi:hypothetical protein
MVIPKYKFLKVFTPVVKNLYIYIQSTHSVIVNDKIGNMVKDSGLFEV